MPSNLESMHQGTEESVSTLAVFVQESENACFVLFCCCS
jgi:hypothetical protein